jgi:hypothetical protein
MGMQRGGERLEMCTNFVRKPEGLGFDPEYRTNVSEQEYASFLKMETAGSKIYVITSQKTVVFVVTAAST